MRPRYAALTGGLAVLLLACLPVEPCACPPARTAAILFGEVRTIEGQPASGRALAMTAGRHLGGTSCDFSMPESLDFHPRAMDDQGRFRAVAYSTSGPALLCVRLAAAAASPSAGDSGAVVLMVPFRADHSSLDSTGVILTLGNP